MNQLSATGVARVMRLPLAEVHIEAVPPPPESDDDVLAPLRKVVCP